MLLPAVLFAGASGTISGYVIDKETGKKLPGASLVVEGTNFGAMADKYGFFVIYNVPVGVHTIRASMIGYVPMKIKDVEVKTDLNTVADFELQSRVLELGEEIVVTAPRVQILRDVLASTQYVGQETINSSFPAQSFYDLLPLSPGYVNGYFRASRSSGVQYLVDGLPASDAWTRAMAFSLPVLAITEMVVQTGGFSAEYGNLTSGLVNLITKDGRNNLGLSLKIASDFLSRYDEVYENAQRAELALGGPLKLGFGGPMFDANYFISGKAEFTDTPYRNELRRSLHAPILQNYDWNAKLMFRLSQKLFLRGQILSSRWDFHQYDPVWEDRTAALPEHVNDNDRVSLSLTHTLSAKMYYQLEASRSNFQRRVSGYVPAGVEDNFVVRAPEDLGTSWPGPVEPWREDIQERQWLGRANLVRQFNPMHQLKVGMEGSYWDLTWHRDRYMLWPNDDAREGGYVYSRYTDMFQENPFSFAVYGHHKIELKDFLATFGLRYELFSPNRAATDLTEPIQGGDPAVMARAPAVLQNIPTPERRTPPSQAGDSSAVLQPQVFHHTFAPRVSIAIPIGNIEHLAVSYGHFYELPPFYYLYVNEDGARSAHWAIYGNTALKPVQAKAWEATYRRAITEQTVFSLTGFWRKYSNLVGMKRYTVVPPGYPASAFQYDSNVDATAGGLEMSYRRQFSQALSGAMTYTYLHGSGTASWPESKFLRHSRGDPELNDNYLSPLAWDQRHTLGLFLSWQSRKGHLLSLFSQIYGPAEAEDWFTGEQIELGWRQFLSIKAAVALPLAGLRWQPFLEGRNLLNVKYAYPEQNGLDFSQPSAPLEDNLGRRIIVGISFN